MFKFPPESIWEMSMEDLTFWNEGTGKVAQWMKAGA